MSAHGVAIPAGFAGPLSVEASTFAAMCERAEVDPDAYWRAVGQRLEWIQPFSRVSDCSYDLNDFRIRWYDDGVLNVAANCLDRHLATHGDKTALIFVKDDPSLKPEFITYRELHARVCRLSEALRALGVGQGDRVMIYLPMTPDAAVAMLACARIGAVHSVVFGGFSATSLAGRIQDCGAKLLITADGGMRGGKWIDLWANVQSALQQAGCECVRDVIVAHNSGQSSVPAVRNATVHNWRTLCDAYEPNSIAEPMNAEDPLFILYTSGSTGKPKGVLHTSGGYLAYASFTHELVFDLRADDIYWCTADVGWITGHSYVVYGPLANGASSVIFEGVPNYPDSARVWQIIDQLGVTIFYTAPTAIRALMRDGDAPLQRSTRSSLRLLGTVGEPINPAAWQWYFAAVGGARCPIVDTWWQTETGGILMSPLPAVDAAKPGAAMHGLPGIYPLLLDNEQRPVSGVGSGNLVLTQSWPGQMRTVFGDHTRFLQTYFSAFPGYYQTGDGAHRDADGHYWITGRVDDVINVSGHRIGTAEVESALVAHPSVAEAAVVGMAHDLKGQAIAAFVLLKQDQVESPALRQALIQQVRSEIGPLATPEKLVIANGLPKTRSGKIMRRILRKIAEHAPAEQTEAELIASLGDISTLADTSVVAELIAKSR